MKEMLFVLSTMNTHLLGKRVRPFSLVWFLLTLGQLSLLVSFLALGFAAIVYASGALA